MSDENRKRDGVMKRAKQPPARAGFTLIELLVVITFIGILAALTASATMRIISVQQSKNTETNLLKLYSLLEQHWKAVISKAAKDETNIPGSAITLAGGDPKKPDNPPIVVNRA